LFFHRFLGNRRKLFRLTKTHCFLVVIEDTPVRHVCRYTKNKVAHAHVTWNVSYSVYSLHLFEPQQVVCESNLKERGRRRRARPNDRIHAHMQVLLEVEHRAGHEGVGPDVDRHPRCTSALST
jgi:hypothetical protein